MFGHKSQPSRIFSFGARVAPEHREQASEILYKAHQYGNKLVEIERERRAQVHALLTKIDPAYEALKQAFDEADEEVEELLREVKRHNSTQRKRGGTPEQRAALKDARKRRKDLGSREKSLRKSLYLSDLFQQESAVLEAECARKTKEAYAEAGECGVPWGTRLLIGQAHGGDRSGAPPKFKAFEGEGRIGVQVQGGAPAENLEFLRQIQIDPPPPHSGKNPWREGRIRIGSEGRTPVWLPFRVKMHRDLPEDGRVKWAWLLARKVGTRTKWSLQITVAQEHGWDYPNREISKGTVAVNMGWRLLGDGSIRVAMCEGDDGEQTHVQIPPDKVEAYRFTEELQSKRDRLFDVIKENIKASGITFPEEISGRVAKLQALQQWRSPRRLARLVRIWSQNRFDGDDEIYRDCEAWLGEDAKLYNLFANLRRRLANWRKNYYRNVAAELSSRYRTVILADTDWRDFAHGPDAANPEETMDRIRRHRERARRQACVHLLKECLKERMYEHREEEGAWITQTCSQCGECEPFDAEHELVHVCSHCGEEWDQDSNAAWNLLARASEPVLTE